MSRLALYNLPGRQHTGARLAIIVVLGYLTVAGGVWLGLWGDGWSQLTGEMWEPPSARHWLGTNLLGQDIFQRAIASTASAFEIGLIVALASTLFGTVIGGVAGYFSQTWLDEVLLWLKGTFEAIPFYLLVAAVAFALQRHPWSMHLAMIVTFWTPTARVVRAEAMRIARRDFIEAARAGGASPARIITRHVLPNLNHIVLVQATLVFVAAIKAEVVLSFLGIGVQDSISWGVMIAEAGQEIVAGRYMNFVVASGFLFVLVMAFNRVADHLQDRLDPRTRQFNRAGANRYDEGPPVAQSG